MKGSRDYVAHRDERKNWIRTWDGNRARYYWRGIRMPWLAWVMFS